MRRTPNSPSYHDMVSVESLQVNNQHQTSRGISDHPQTYQKLIISEKAKEHESPLKSSKTFWEKLWRKQTPFKKRRKPFR